MSDDVLDQIRQPRGHELQMAPRSWLLPPLSSYVMICDDKGDSGGYPKF